MAAIDPTAEPISDEEGKTPAVCRSTLRLVKIPPPILDDDDEDDDDEDEYLRALLEGADDDDDETNGGPSDPAKAKKRKQAAAIKKLLEATQDDEDEDEEMEDAKPNGVQGKGKDLGAAKGKGKGKGKAEVNAKGKAKATEADEEEEEDDSDNEDEDQSDSDLDSDSDSDAYFSRLLDDSQKLVVCTLDTDKVSRILSAMVRRRVDRKGANGEGRQTYQQAIDITVNEGEEVLFSASGTHNIYLTGNYIMDDDEYDSEDDDEYDLSPDELDYDLGSDASDDESDELDGLENPRVTELDSDEEEAPKLVEAGGKKGKNKRPADETTEAEGLDDMMAKAGDGKLSKKQQKKLKNNKGEAVPAEDGKKDKKVQFAKNLEQGPSNSAADKAKEGGKGSVGVKTVQGVTVDDRTIGKGRTVKKGDTVGVRYIGKLQDGQQFDGE